VALGTDVVENVVHGPLAAGADWKVYSKPHKAVPVTFNVAVYGEQVFDGTERDNAYPEGVPEH
jgi:hypothetical protein